MSGGLLIFIIIVILSSISSSNSKKRREQQEMEGFPAFDEGVDEEHPQYNERSLDDVLKEFLDDEFEEKQQPEIINLPQKEIRPIEQERIVTPLKPINIQSSKTLEKSNNSIRSKELDQISKSQRDNKSIEANDFLTEFDMRKAIIYSEILSPKYKEY